MTPKLVIFGKEVREKLLTGINIVANAVGLTLGVKGRNVAIERKFNYPHVIHDGVTVAKSINLKDPFENMGADLIKESAIKTNDLAGDGTTTTTVLTQALVAEGFKAIEAGVNPMTLIKGLEQATQIILDELKKIATPIETKEEMKQVATISSGFEELGELIADTFEKTGKKGLVTVEKSNNIQTSVSHKEGLDYNKGLLSPYFMTDPSRMEASLEEPTIFITDLPIYTVENMLGVVQKMLDNPAKTKNGNLVIIADTIKDRALELLVANKLRGNFNIIATEAPAYGDFRKELLQDIATVTGATFVSKDTGMTLESVLPEYFGTCQKVVSTKDSTMIVGGAGLKTSIDARIREIQDTIESTSSEYEQEKLQERLAKLTTGVAVIYVGGTTEVEIEERRERVIDAVNATKSALEEGIVPGGAITLHNLKDKILTPKQVTQDELLGYQVLHTALSAPLTKLLSNAGEDVSEVIDKISKSKIKNAGFNVSSGKVVNLLKEGIIDPVKVTRLALQNSVSVASMILTTDCLVAEERTEGGETK